MKMDERKFSALIVQHGTDIAAFPIEVRDAALVFADTVQGRRILREERQLTDGLWGLKAAEQGNHPPLSDDFIMKLQEIPVVHPQPKASQTKVGRLEGVLSDVEAWLTPFGLAAQVAAVGVVMVMGVLVGMQDRTVFDGDIDVTEGLFADAGYYPDERVEEE